MPFGARINSLSPGIREMLPSVYGRGSGCYPHTDSALGAGQDTRSLVDRVDALHRGENRVEGTGIGQLELEAQARDAVGARLRRARDDVDVVLGECVGDVAQ